MEFNEICVIKIYWRQLSPDSPGVQPLARLVWYKANEIRRNIENKLDMSTWTIWDSIPAEFVDSSQGIAHHLVLRILADCDTRIMLRLQSWPVSLL